MLTHYENKDITSNRWFIVASGPSLKREDVDKLHGRNVIVINDNYLLAPWANILYACDPQWWIWHKDKPELKNFKGKKYSQTESWTESDMELFKKNFNVNFLQSKNIDKLSLEKNVITQGSNSGIQAINLAYHLGATQIYLLGYDMQTTGGKSHWFGDHPNKVVSCYKNWLSKYHQLADHAKEINLEVINCTRETALTCFSRKSLDDVLSE